MTADLSNASETWSGAVRVVRAGEVIEELSAACASDEPLGHPADLRYQAGSISKLVVSTVVLRLVEQQSLQAPWRHRLAMVVNTGRVWRRTSEAVSAHEFLWS